MLAERRQRKRYNLMPKGKALYEDESRFGTKILEKMGWKKGEGLGASSDGSKDFIRIRYKNDAFGLGFEQRDDQWTQHERSFSGLLKTLNNEEIDEKLKREDEGVDDNEELSSRVGFGFQEAYAKEESKSESKKLKEKISGVSLEERSKQSKARVHYKKFTKGKDLAQYSEKDLANIFGKKAVDEEKVDDFYKSLNNTFGVINEEASTAQTNGTVNGNDGADSTESANKKKKKKDQDREKEKKNELQDEKQNIQPHTYTSNLTIHDYFKIKMEAIRNKKSETNDNSAIELNNFKNPSNSEQKLDIKEKNDNLNLQDNSLQEPVEKKLKKNKKRLEQANSFGNEIAKEANIEEENHSAKENEENTVNEKTSEVKALVNDCLRKHEKKKSKKSKNKADQENFAKDNVQGLCKDFILEHDERKSKKNNTTGQENFVGNGFDKESRARKKGKKSQVLDTAETKFTVEETKRHNKDLEVVDKLMKFKENETGRTAQISLPEIKPKKEKNMSKTEIHCDLSNVNKGTKKGKVEDSETKFTTDLVDEETALVQKSTVKKKNKTEKLLNEVIEISDSNEDEPAKKKSKRIKELAQKTSAHENNLTISKPNDSDEEITANKKKNVVGDLCNKQNSKTDVNLEEIDLDELKKKYQEFNIFPISSYCAEKFRNISLNSFEGSSLPDIEGYGLNSDIELSIYVNENDQDRITKLWQNIYNKYEQTGKPIKLYRKYIKETITARKHKQKAPKLYVKSWQRKNAFQLV